MTALKFGFSVTPGPPIERGTAAVRCKSALASGDQVDWANEPTTNGAGRLRPVAGRRRPVLASLWVVRRR